MDILYILIPNLIPLYILIAFGYIGGKYLEVNLPSMATISIYFISPIVVFGAIARLPLDPTYLALPFIMFCIALIVIIGSYWLSGFFFKDNLQNLVGLSSGNGNTGYYGLPIVMALFGPEATSIYLLANFGAELCTITAGYYLGARGVANVRDSLLKVLKLPVVHAVWLGLLWNVTMPALPVTFYEWWDKFAGAWVIIGMMLIGVALTKVQSLRLNPKLLSYLFAVRFLTWPLLIALVIFLDKTVFHFYNETIYTLMLIFGLVPISGNTAAYAAQLNVRPGEAALVVLLSTIFALFYIPAVLLLFL
jgi:hypothetical protein